MSKENKDEYLGYKLPLLEKDFEETYPRLKEIFKELITSETENKDFFDSPVKYLKENGALRLDTLFLPDGQEVPLVQDEALVQTVRKARDLYRDGKLECATIKAGFVYKRTSEVMYVYKDEEIRLFAKAYRNRGAAIFKDGMNTIEIDGQFIGPLADPSTLELMQQRLEEQ
jgi:hypothetical protein